MNKNNLLRNIFFPILIFIYACQGSYKYDPFLLTLGAGIKANFPFSNVVLPLPYFNGGFNLKYIRAEAVFAILPPPFAELYGDISIGFVTIGRSKLFLYLNAGDYSEVLINGKLFGSGFELVIKEDRQKQGYIRAGVVIWGYQGRNERVMATISFGVRGFIPSWPWVTP